LKDTYRSTKIPSRDGKVVNATISKILATSSTPEFPLSVLYIAVTAPGLLLLNGLIKLEVLRADGERATLLRVATRMFLVNLGCGYLCPFSFSVNTYTDKSTYVKGLYLRYSLPMAFITPQRTTLWPRIEEAHRPSRISITSPTQA
jgi:hypothetical protein